MQPNVKRRKNKLQQGGTARNVGISTTGVLQRSTVTEGQTNKRAEWLQGVDINISQPPKESSSQDVEMEGINIGNLNLDEALQEEPGVPFGMKRYRDKKLEREKREAKWEEFLEMSLQDSPECRCEKSYKHETEIRIISSTGQGYHPLWNSKLTFPQAFVSRR